MNKGKQEQLSESQSLQEGGRIHLALHNIFPKTQQHHILHIIRL
jgi:hypothetical protein